MDFPPNLPRRHLENIFAGAYDKYAEAIFRYCYFKTSDRETAKDLVQQVFLKTWTYLRQGGTVREFRPFLYRLAANEVIDWYRRRKDDSLDRLIAEGFNPADEQAAVTTQAELNLVLVKLAKLEDGDRNLIIWHYLEGLAPGEIGEIIGQSENVVSVRLHRAKKKLQALDRPSRKPPTKQPHE